MSKPLLRELPWLLAAIAITAALSIAISGWRFFDRTLDIHLGDTYYVISAEIILIPFFFLVSFLLFLLKEIRHRFSRMVPSVFIIGSGIFLIAMISNVAKYLPVIWGLTIYPPLSSLGSSEINNINYELDENANSLAIFLIALQAAVAIVIVYVGYKTGFAKSKKA